MKRIAISPNFEQFPIEFHPFLRKDPVVKLENRSIEHVGAIINRPRALNERPYIHGT